MKKALITGINGSGASYLAEHLVNKPNLQVQGITRWHTDRSSNLEKVQDKVKLFECDLTDMGAVIRALEEAQPDYIFHMASHANVRLCFVNPSSIFNNNVNGTLNLLEAVRILKIKPVIQFCGTSEVYGQVRVEDTPIKESQKIDPVNVYAISKLAQEKLCKSYWLSYGIPVVLTRAFTYINPRRPDIFSSAFARQVVEIERGKRNLIVHGNLDSTRTIIDVRDIMEAYWQAAVNCVHGEEYNIGGTEYLTVGEFLQKLVEHAKVPIATQLDKALLRPVDVTMQIPDVSKFQKQTGWKANYKLDESIEFLLNHYREKIV
jgi:GDP-4-dehydro-6-deoxy-D-mannose reductase